MAFHAAAGWRLVQVAAVLAGLPLALLSSWFYAPRNPRHLLLDRIADPGVHARMDVAGGAARLTHRLERVD